MAYAYWKANKHQERAVFDLYFRKNPFGGEYTVFAGLEECIRLIANFKFTEDDISFIRESLPGSCEDGFFDYLRGLDCSEVEVYAIAEGSVVFPKVPLLRIEGPIAVAQLLETPLVNLINFASLVATNAARHRFVAGKSKSLLEFGLRRAQGPDGGISASKYCYLGGFDATRSMVLILPSGKGPKTETGSFFKAVETILVYKINVHEFDLEREYEPPLQKKCFIFTYAYWHMVPKLAKGSNVAAGRLFGIPLRGTHSHAFVSSYMVGLVSPSSKLSSGLQSPDEIIDKSLQSADGSSSCEDFVSSVQTWINKIQCSNSLRGIFGETNQSELAAFTSYALAFPRSFLALVDTYDVMRSGIPNFCAVALALNDLGYKAAGIRLDSGDLAYLSCEARKFFGAIEKEFGVPGFGKMGITASNDLNEETLDALNKQGHEVDSYGIGTYLVTCYAQAALGCVFKLVEINNQPRIKLSEDVSRLYGREGYPLVDIMTGENEPSPKLIGVNMLKFLTWYFGETNQSELAAFTSYALAFPRSFLALVDTYDVSVVFASRYKAAGIRLDSGDLAYLSCEARKFFGAIEKEFGVPGFGKMGITASNDLNEETLDALNKQGHEVDSYGIGTYLVTCYAQAALGCVFKLVEINNQPRIKLSEDVSKVSIPCKKRSYRLYGREGYPLVDIMTGENEPSPKVGERILCRHPFNESKRAYVVPQQVEELLKCYWPGSSDKPREDLPPLKDIRDSCIKQLERMRPDHMRKLNPTPYKVSVSAKLYDFIHFLWLNEAPVGELQ
ncbi:hypothetical protein POTOM_026998 [Populus tomentosa]|uniref:Nicotinate phosphoribosyltransferase n=1 Tax=Populus tomentosa TaxID=118781 RepID=A0A8X7ZFI7_POPTO|nr:hypothetical protein POTOM_026998 [Populus tomentosa]